MKKLDRKVKVALLSVGSNTALIIFKILAGILSGSVSIISEAIHSSMDLLASLIAFFSVKMSGKPADKDHPYGHGKIENVSGVIEGILIFAAAFLIIKEAAQKIMHPSGIEEVGIAVGVMLLSAAINLLVSRKLYKVSKEEDSIALEADALHLKTDVYTSFGVALGLLLIKLTGINILDPIVAILVACLIIKESWVLCRNAFNPLLDSRLSDEEESEIDSIIMNYKDRIVDYHMLRTRKSGNIKYIDFHVTVDEGMSVRDSHQLSDEIEAEIENKLKHTEVIIHIEPNSMGLGRLDEQSDNA